MKAWDELSEEFQCEEVWEYYKVLKERRVALVIKFILDKLVSLILLILLAPVLFIIGILVFSSSPGGILFCQRRVTTYGRVFTIYKFRTMVKNADRLGSQVTTKEDIRITKVGRFLRKVRLDELPQLINILKGDMSLVGTRPEVEKYVDSYSREMLATLLLPAGVTSEASIVYKGEEELLTECKNVDEVYLNQILPAKMEYNLRYVKHFSLWADVKLIFKTVVAVLH